MQQIRSLREQLEVLLSDREDLDYEIEDLRSRLRDLDDEIDALELQIREGGVGLAADIQELAMTVGFALDERLPLWDMRDVRKAQQDIVRNEVCSDEVAGILEEIMRPPLSESTVRHLYGFASNLLK